MTPSPRDPATERTALASPRADLRELSANTRATAAELEEFLRDLRGKSPQEMLGIVAASHLARALVLATIVVAAGTVLFTAIPFVM
ncbi:MAG: hypothetical protein HKO57_00960, partial [Akkermansiaceae bacterium]|nr:hypothetical protein [Akkermansiaceae bacterium]